jgi:predicted AAA+ superfamily ATPase
LTFQISLANLEYQSKLVVLLKKKPMLPHEVITCIEQISPWLPKPFQANAALAAYLPEKYIHRQVQCALKKNNAFVLVGPRQVGKTTLAWKTLDWITEAIQSNGN